MTVSVVNHGHDAHLRKLLAQLAARPESVGHVIVTQNLPVPPVEPPPAGWPFRLTEVFNERPLGFGANHNRAFQHCSTDTFCVLNPDIELPEPGILGLLLRQLQQPRAGLAYPLLYNPDGTRQQNEREVMTPWALLRRHLLRRQARRVDWVSGAFWVVPAAVWRSVGGFDERYHMYCEDADFCLRLQLAGWRLCRTDIRAVHDAGWASRRIGRPMAWHALSLLKLWATPAFRAYVTRGPLRAAPQE